MLNSWRVQAGTYGRPRPLCTLAWRCFEGLRWSGVLPRTRPTNAPPNGLQIDFVREVSVSRRGTAAVVDGARLLLTPLRHTLVPPPMCAVTARSNAPVTSVAFCDHGPCEVQI